MTLKTQHLVIDLIPLLPGGVNGGAKLVVLNLLKGLKQHILTDSSWRITLLTAPWNHAELQQYVGTGITCKMLEHLTQGKRSINSIIKKIHYKISQLPLFPALLTQLQADLLFCPFSNPSLNRIPIPCLSILYDLQHWQYPHFFTPQEIGHRHQYLRRMIQHSDLIICISEFSQRSLHHYCEAFKLSPKGTAVIYPYFYTHNAHNHCFSTGSDQLVNYSPLLQKAQLISTPYLLYPANYWPHKNHRCLLQAYAQYLQWYQEVSPEMPHVDLVFTGTLDAEEQQMKALAHQLDIADQVHFLGYLEEQDFEAIWLACEGLIFPSLYEGFGLPIVEAMERSKPILCSQIPCLEEVTAGACLYFNPEQSDSIAEVLKTFTLNPPLRQHLKQQSQTRFQYFKTLNPLQDYLALFTQILQSHEH